MTTVQVLNQVQPKSAISNMIFDEIVQMALQGRQLPPEQVAGKLRHIAEVAVAGIPLVAALHELPSIPIRIETGRSDSLGGGSFSGFDSGVNEGLGVPGLGWFNTAAETVGQDFLRELMEFMRTMFKRPVPTAAPGPRPPKPKRQPKTPKPTEI